MCSQPPGLCDEPTAVALQPDSSLSVVVSDPLPAGQGFSSFSAMSRGRQSGPDSRAQEKAALAEETQNFFVRTTGKDEAPMQPEFKGMKLETLRKERDGWRKLAEEKQQLQDKKEEAWELFRRQPNWESKRREDFEREYKQKVVTQPLYSPFASSKREDKFLQEWITISECGPLISDVVSWRTMSKASVASSFATMGIPANEADTLGDRSGSPRSHVPGHSCDNIGANIHWLIDKFNLDLSLVARLGGHLTPEERSAF